VNDLGLKQYIVLAVDPNDQHISPYFDPNMPGQYGHKSLWMQPSKDDNCNVCGANPDTPTATVSPSKDAIKEAIAQQQAAEAATDEPQHEETPPATMPPSTLPPVDAHEKTTNQADSERDIWQPPSIDN
jgi:hypothetical protein